MYQFTERFDTLLPRPGAGKRILKSKLLIALGATDANRPFPGNTERIIERKIILQNTFNPNASSGGGGGGPVGPCAAGTTFANAWSAQVVANGGAAPSQAHVTAIANFQCGLITDGLDAQMIMWNAFAADNLTAARTPPLPGGGNVLWANTNFVGGDVTATGVKGDGVGKFFDTVSDPIGASTTMNSCGTVIYTTVTAASNSGRAFGTLNLGFLLSASNDNTANAFGAEGANPSNVITTPSQGAGYYSNQRINASDHRLFFANGATAHAQIGATDVNLLGGTGLPAQNFYVFCLNNAGATFGFTAETLGFVAITKGLTAAQSAALFARVQTLMTAFGRNV